MIYREDFKIKNMTGSATGTAEAPGRQVAQKSGLNRAILDQGWGKFFNGCTGNVNKEERR